MTPESRARLRAKHIELVRKAKAGLPRNADGGVSEAELLEKLIQTLPFDVDAAQRRYAQSIIDDTAREDVGGSGKQLCFPGHDPFDWEPDSQVRDNAGYLYDRKDAPFEAIDAENERAMLNVQRAVRKQAIKAHQVRVFSRWAIEEAGKGRLRRELTWGNCVAELNLIRDKAA